MTTETRSRRALLKPLALLGVVALVLLLFMAQDQTAYATTITVNTTDDELNADGDCSLREAIQAVNTGGAVDACAAGSGAADTIMLPAGTYRLNVLVGAGEDDGSAIFFQTGKSGKSATRIEWDLDAGITSATLTVTIQTRPSPGKGHKKKGGGRRLQAHIVRTSVPQRWSHRL